MHTDVALTFPRLIPSDPSQALLEKEAKAKEDASKPSGFETAPLAPQPATPRNPNHFLWTLGILSRRDHKDILREICRVLKIQGYLWKLQDHSTILVRPADESSAQLIARLRVYEDDKQRLIVDLERVHGQVMSVLDFAAALVGKLEL